MEHQCRSFCRISPNRSRMCNCDKTSHRVKVKAQTKKEMGMVDFFLATSKLLFDWVSSEVGVSAPALERFYYSASINSRIRSFLQASDLQRPWGAFGN
jgi:hypothetical protein